MFILGDIFFKVELPFKVDDADKEYIGRPKERELLC